MKPILPPNYNAKNLSEKEKATLAKFHKDYIVEEIKMYLNTNLEEAMKLALTNNLLLAITSGANINVITYLDSGSYDVPYVAILSDGSILSTSQYPYIKIISKKDLGQFEWEDNRIFVHKIPIFQRIPFTIWLEAEEIEEEFDGQILYRYYEMWWLGNVKTQNLEIYYGLDDG